jgi:isopentenyl-diphosphate delta-isomerase
MEERVVIVNPDGTPKTTGDGEIMTLPKRLAHIRAEQHLAISVYVFDSEDKLLIQQRSQQKETAPGAWANSCCTHPGVNEPPLNAAERRLQQEMGIPCVLRELTKLSYYVPAGRGMTEYEYTHVFVGYSEATPQQDSQEVSNWTRAPLNTLLEAVPRHPWDYAPWFQACLPYVAQEFQRLRQMGAAAFAPVHYSLLPTKPLKKCFVICLLGKEESDVRRAADDFLEKVIRPVIPQFGFDPRVDCADLSHVAPDIMKDIDSHLTHSDLVIADLTGLNPKVFYELGKRHAFGGATVAFTKDDPGSLPFDISHLRIYRYSLSDDSTIAAAQTALANAVEKLPAGRGRALP